MKSIPCSSLPRKGALLASSALATALVLASPEARAACVANGTTTVTVDCAATTTTTDTTNSTSTNTTTNDRIQSFDAALVGTVQSGIAVGGAGLDLKAAGATAHTVDMTNSGAVSISAAGVSGSAMQLDGNGGAITYGGAGSIAGGASNGGLAITNTGNGNITFNGTGAVSSGFTAGIFTQAAQGGVTTINVANDVTGAGLFFGAMTAFGVNGLTTVNMSAGTVAGGAAGIEASSSGTGGVRVNMTGGSIGTSSAATGGNSGIYTSSSGTAGNVSVTAGPVYAKYTGIYAQITNAASTGNIQVDSNGVIVVTTAPVAADQGAIHAANAGSGSVTLNVHGAISAMVTDGIGVSATGTGSGAVTVNVGADVSAGTNVNGRAVTAGGTGGDTTINMTAGTIQTGGDALRGVSLGTGNVIVNMTGGQIGGPGGPGLGVPVYNGIVGQNLTGAAGGISITAGTIYADAIGIMSTIGNAANSSNTSVTANGAIRAGSTAISVSTAGSGNITVTNNAAISGANAVAFFGGTNNSLTNSVGGNITTNTGLNGHAVLGGTGNDTISNFGTMTGMVNLGTGTNAFTNQGTGTYNAGVALTLGAGNAFTNKGSYAPGGAGTLMTTALTGNFVQTSTGSYLVDITPSSADRTVVSGTASLAGAVRATFASGSYMANSYTILTSSGRTGTFSNLSSINLPNSFVANLSYTATDVRIDLTADLGGGGGGGGGGGAIPLTRNQSAPATALNNYFNAGNALPPQFVALFGLPGASLGNGLDQLSGEVATGAAGAGFKSMDSFLGLMLDPFLETQVGGGAAQQRAMGFAPERPLPPAIASAYDAVGIQSAADPATRRWGSWAAAYGAQANRQGDATVGSHALDARTGGGAAGVDYRVSPNTVIGAAISGGFTNWGVNTLGSGRGENFQAGLYGSSKFGSAYLSAALAYGWHELSTSRSVSLPGAFDRLNADFRAQQYGGRIEAGYRLALMNFGVTPYAAAQVQGFHTPNYTETGMLGAGGFALSYAAHTSTQLRSELGTRFDNRIALEGGAGLILRGRAAWLHDYSDRSTATAFFQVLPGSEFTVSGAAPFRDAALVSLGSELRLSSGLTLSAKADGEFAAHGNAYGGTATLRYAW